MRKRRQRNKQTDAVFPLQVNELESLIKNKFENNSDEDLIFSIYEHQGKKIAVFCLPYLIDTNKLEIALLALLLSSKHTLTNQSLLNDIPLRGASTTESVVIGPQLAFTESLNTNMNVLRQILPSTDLVLEKMIVGEKIPREVRLVYLKSMANDADVNTMRQRIQDVDVDEIESSTVLK